MDKYFDFIMIVITIRLPYLEYILFIKKILKLKKILKVLAIIQKQVSFYNKCLFIFVLHTILKIYFSKIKMFIINDIDFNIKI